MTLYGIAAYDWQQCKPYLYYLGECMLAQRATERALKTRADSQGCDFNCRAAYMGKSMAWRMDVKIKIDSEKWRVAP